MPRLSEKARVTSLYDKRIKLTIEQRQDIIKLHADGHSLRELGKLYGVDKNLIKGIVDPQWDMLRREAEKIRQRKYRELLKISPERRRKRNEHMKTHRDYKESLYKDGLIDIARHKDDGI